MAKKNYVVVTGASSGLGESFCKKLASHDWHVFPCVRNQQDAERLREQGSAIHPLILDVTNAKQVTEAVMEVMQIIGDQKLSGLINNAGIAKIGPLALQDLDEIEQHFSVNTLGLMRVTQAFLPLLGLDRNRKGNPGRIINITSVGGEVAAPFLGAYSASKHATESFTDSLRRELLPFRIEAIAVGPGSVKTPIWQKAKEADAAAKYADTAWGGALKVFLDTMIKGGETGLEPSEIADVVFDALQSSNPKARYAPVPNKFRNYILPTLLPKRVVDKAFQSRFKIK